MLAAMVLAVSAPVAMAAGWGDDHGGGMGGGMGGGHHKADKEWDNKAGPDSEGHMTMRMRMVWNLYLNDRQRKEVRAITRELRAKVWALEDKMEDVSDELFQLYGGKHRDPKAIGKVYSKIFDLRRQKIELQIEAGNRIEALLNAEQKKNMHKYMPKPRWGASW